MGNIIASSTHRGGVPFMSHPPITPEERFAVSTPTLRMILGGKTRKRLGTWW